MSSLAALGVLDTPPEAEFDALARAAALVCGVPVSLISLVDAERQWFKANVGLPGISETPRDLAFCAHAILQEGLFEIGDATADPRFAGNPLVTSHPDIRFYAGATLVLSDGTRAGTLCVIDRTPRRLADWQRQVLLELARAAVRALEGRRALEAERVLVAELAATSGKLAASEERFRRLSEASPTGVFSTDAKGACDYTNARWQEIYGLSLEQSIGEGWSSTLHPDDRTEVFAEWTRAAETGEDFDMQFRIRRPDGGVRDVRARSRPTRDAEGRVSGHIGTVEDVSEARATRDRLESEQRRLSGIIEGTGAGTWEWNVRTGETRFNERWAAIVGSSLEALGPTTIRTWLELTHPEDLPRCQALLARHFSGEADRYECEVRMRHADGHWVWVLDRGRVLTRTPDGEPEWMFGTHLDITERKMQEESLRTSETLLNRTGEVAGVGGWELDLQTGELRWSAQTRAIHGVPEDFVPVLERAIDFYAPEARPVIQSAVEHAMKTGAEWDLELPLVRADGRRIWVRAVGHAEFEDGRPVKLMGAFQDITQRRALFAELAKQHELLRVTLQSIGDAVITTDSRGTVTWLNPIAERMTGWPSAQAEGRPVGLVFQVVDERTREPATDPVEACLRQAASVGLPDGTVLISRTGQAFGIEASASPIRREAGEMLGAVLVFRDVTEQRRLTGEMHHRATHDALTGLVNRAEFEIRLGRVLQRSHEERSAHALMYLDLDQFKLVNDACGHAIGDQLLRQVGQLLGECVRSRDTLARLGGDEFGLILEHCSVEQAQLVAMKLCERMDEFRFVHGDRRFRVGASIGLVPVDSRWRTAAAVMQAADASCYSAKEAGRNRVHVWFDTDQAVRTRHGEMQWASRIEQALDDDRFELHAQRIVPLRVDDDRLHAEVLLRLRDTDGSLVSPGAFLPAAERFSLASRIDRWVLERVIGTLASSGDLAGVACIGVNLSGQSVGDRSFHRHALALLQEAGRDVCERLCLEITETVAVTNIADASAFVAQSRSLGVRVALDDFGAGASSFGYLKRIPVDLIKIDGQFIRDLASDPLDVAAVRCFVDVARVVGTLTVAEFVDKPAVLERVREIGIDFAQGFLLHEPEPFDALFRSRTLLTARSG